MKTIMWDFDGTLAFRKNGGFSEALCEVIRKNKPETTITKENFKNLLSEGFFWHNPEYSHVHLNESSELWWKELSPVFKNAYMKIGLSETEAADYSMQVGAEYTSIGAFELYEDVIPVLEYMKQRGYEQIILSNHTPELPRISSELGLSGFMKLCITSAKYGYEKPNKIIYETAIEKIGGNSDDIWMIGDSYYADVFGANQVGLKAIQVRTKQNENSKYYAENLYGLKNIIF